MSLPAAARYTNTLAGGYYSGFSVPGIEVYEHDCEGAPCEPCEVDDGDTCRPRWVNRQDHGWLTRLNIARASHPGVCYGCPEENLECTVPDLRTTVYPGKLDEGGYDPEEMYPEDVYAEGMAGSFQRRFLAERVRQRAQVRQADMAQAVAGARQAVETRSRHQWGNHNNHNERAVGIRYIPLAGSDHDVVGASMEGDYDCLIVAPGHVRCDFYED